jgi:hypothetical protein
VTLIGVLIGLSCIATDISIAYLHGQTQEKVYTVEGPEFGPEIEGRTMIIEKAHGTKSYYQTRCNRWDGVLASTQTPTYGSRTYAHTTSISAHVLMTY